MDLRSTLREELQRRRSRNPRYSMRAFARALGTHHSTLSQILQQRRRLTARAIRALGARLGLSAAQIGDACVAENCAAIRRLVGDARFIPDSRWIATMTGIPLDDVNLALHWLLYRRQLTMRTRTTWTSEH
jgi:transcriptional regulator with XRE-family HTH domain